MSVKRNVLRESSQDAYSETFAMPRADPQQSVELVSMNDNGTMLTATIRRPLDTCDPRDWRIQVCGDRIVQVNAKRS